MASEQYVVGPSPHVVVVECAGSLDVRGSEREEVKVQSDSVPCKVQPAEDRIEVRCTGNCVIRMPQGGSLEVRRVHGALQIQDVVGSVRVGTVYGACHVRRVETLHIEGAQGEVTLREVGKEVAVGSVGGSLYLRDIGGPITVGEVGGELLGRDIPYGITVGHVGGNLAVRSRFEAGTSSTFRVGGSALFRVLPWTGVRFVLPAAIPLKLEQGMEAFTEGEHRVVTIGDGAAVVRIEQAVSVRIKLRDDYPLEDEAIFAFAASEGLDQHVQRLSEHVRSRVERHLSAAQRRVERAQRRAERAAQRVRGAGLHFSFALGGLPPASEPVSDRERLAILKMLEEGKITVEQAQKLLDAIEGGG